MAQCCLTLTPFGKAQQIIPLFPQSVGRSMLDYITTSEFYVYSDLTYDAEIQNPFLSDIDEAEFYLNGTFIATTITSDGKIEFIEESFGKRIFCDCYGFVQVSIVIRSDGDEQVFTSDYLTVMVKKGTQNNSIRRMADFVYANNETFLFGKDIHPKDLSGLKESDYKSLESRIVLLDSIAMCYEENFRYFKTNSRFRTATKESVDKFEKLQFISSNTIQYIVQHPEELRIVHYNSGIRYNKSYLQPQKTLISKSAYSYDIYENQVIVGFLRSTVDSIQEMITQVAETIDNIPSLPEEIDGYVASSFFIYSSTKKLLEDFQNELLRLSERFIALYGAYREILEVSKIAVTYPPKPTAIFLSVPQYRQTFNAIVEWFKFGIFNLRKEKFMLSFLKVNVLYECYVLTKISQFLQNRGYVLQEKSKCYYTFSGKTQYRNVDFSNTFKYKGTTNSVTLYYQPVVYSENRRQANGIGLYRNTTISFPKSIDSNANHGTYYSPDYILKIETPDCSSYIILDAKFSTIETVKKYQIPALAFKYLFSISPIDANDNVLGLGIFNGQSKSVKDQCIDVYDKCLVPDSITPFAKVLTLTENNENNSAEHQTLLKKVFDKFLE